MVKVHLSLVFEFDFILNRNERFNIETKRSQRGHFSSSLS